MGAFSRRLDKGVTGEPCSPLRISVFKKGKILLFLRWWNAVPAAFPADRTASGFPVRFHAPDALSNRESTGLLQFSTSVSTACGKLKERKNPISAVHLHRRKICGVESAVEDCGMRFPQPVQSTTPCGRVFHEILHKLSLSTPQSFPFSTQKKLLHFSGFFPRMSCGEKVPGISGKKLGFHFSGVSTSTTISFLSFYSFFL